MKMVKLDPRLEKIGSLVRKDTSIVDVGTDHGYLIGNLTAMGQIKGGLACDINAKPLEKAQAYIRLLGLEDRIVTKLCDGFQGAEMEFDDGVVAGMGGDLITRIMLDSAVTRDPQKRFVLQPMTKSETLRRCLWAEGFDLCHEEAVASGRKCYSVMVWQYTGIMKEPTYWERYIGAVTLSPNQDTEDYLQRMNYYLQKKIHGIADAKEKEEMATLLLRIRDWQSNFLEKRC